MNAANAANQQVVPQLPLPAPEAPLDREQLLMAAMHAASAFATGSKDGSAQKDLTDKKFEFRIRFGCGAPGSNGSKKPLDWSFNDKTGTLKVRATPTLSTEDSPVHAISGESFEAVEGFWVARPWLLKAACPLPEPEPVAAEAEARPAPAKDKPGPNKSLAADAAGTGASEDGDEGEAAPAQTVGIAQFFTATGPRTMRRAGRPYQATKALDAKSRPSGGFDLVLSGRLAPLPNGRVIACTRAKGGGERPSCVISVEFGKVWIERADTHEQLAQWGSG